MIRQKLIEMGGEFTGSRVYGFPKPDSDYDYVLYDEDGELIEDLMRMGFSAPSDDEKDSCGELTDFASLKMQDGEETVNAIVCLRKSFYDEFLEAREHCIKFAPLRRDDAVEVHQYYLYGGTLDEYYWGEPD